MTISVCCVCAMNRWDEGEGIVIGWVYFRVVRNARVCVRSECTSASAVYSSLQYNASTGRL